VFISVNKRCDHERDERVRRCMKPSMTLKNIPKEKWIPESLWKRIVGVVPLACVDVIFQRGDRSILYGWRLLNPYNNVWAFPGGRLLYHENLKQCAKRIAHEYGLRFEELYLNGVFPVSFPKRSDVTVSLAAKEVTGEPRVDGIEFSEFVWARRPPKALGANYRRQVVKWLAASKSNEFLRLNRLQSGA
jgi:ADP-ribose pyrophosphatase YjhB (NUDIX family)